jgi:hypothetical protein
MLQVWIMLSALRVKDKQCMLLVVEGVDKYQEVGDDEQQERGHHKETKKGYPINADKNINGSKVINY